MCDKYHINVVKEKLEHRLDCRSDLANSSYVVNGPSTLAAPQSGHPTSVSRAIRVALLSLVETTLVLITCES